MNKTTVNDRLFFTVLISVIIHLVLILGVSFKVPSPLTNEPQLNLEITLVKQQTELEPEQADFLAQANNEGGGETDEKTPEPTPEVPLPEKPTEVDAAPIATPLQPQPLLEPVVTEPDPVDVEKQQPEPQPEPEPVQPVEKPPANTEQVITQEKAETKVVQTPEIEPEPEPVEAPKPTPKRKLSAQELMFQAKAELQRLEQKLDASTYALSKRPKKRFLSSSTKQYAAAAYHEAWRRKVEKIGNMNYPQEAKRQGINGSLMLSVDINPDGSVPPDGIVVSRSSGHKLLDDAAVKIVRLSAPFAPIPENVLQGNDMITIIRTWKFETDTGLFAR